MTACGNWREQLEDHALGLPAGAALARHLDSCAVCARALAEWRARAEQIDAGVRRWMASEPSPGLTQRVLVEISRPKTPWARTPRWRVAFAALALAAAIGFLAYALRGRHEKRDHGDKISSAATAVSRWRSPTETLLRSPADVVLNSVPRLGETYFEFQPHAGASKDEKGGKNAT